MDDVLCTLLNFKGCQSFKNQKNGPFWSPPWKSPSQVTALTSSATLVNERSMEVWLRVMHCDIITNKMEDCDVWNLLFQISSNFVTFETNFGDSF